MAPWEVSGAQQVDSASFGGVMPSVSAAAAATACAASSAAFMPCSSPVLKLNPGTLACSACADTGRAPASPAQLDAALPLCRNHVPAGARGCRRLPAQSAGQRGGWRRRCGSARSCHVAGKHRCDGAHGCGMGSWTHAGGQRERHAATAPCHVPASRSQSDSKPWLPMLSLSDVCNGWRSRWRSSAAAVAGRNAARCRPRARRWPLAHATQAGAPVPPLGSRRTAASTCA